MRLQIGDIEVSAQGSSSLRWEAKVFLATLMLGVAGAVAIALGGVWDVQGSVRYFPLVISLGLLVASGAVIWKNLAQRREELAIVEAADNERAARLSEHLVGRFEAASVEELVAELGWAKSDVLRGLRAGMRGQSIIEDLDLDSGHWIYASASSQVQPPAGEFVESRRTRAGQHDLSIPDKLLKLSRLRAAGVLAERDFQVQKMRLLR